MHCFRTSVEKGMKLCTTVEGCGYKDTLRAHRYISLCALLISHPSYQKFENGFDDFHLMKLSVFQH
jgi:hypothetical protein